MTRFVFFCKNTEYYINQSSKLICITQDCKNHLHQRASYSLQMQHPLPSDQESKLCKNPQQITLTRQIITDKTPESSVRSVSETHCRGTQFVKPLGNDSKNWSSFTDELDEQQVCISWWRREGTSPVN